MFNNETLYIVFGDPSLLLGMTPDLWSDGGKKWRFEKFFPFDYLLLSNRHFLPPHCYINTCHSDPEHSGEESFSYRSDLIIDS